jgi:hypothetical protein
MAVYKQFNTNEVVISPFKANKRFRFEGSQVSSSDVQIEYYQSQQGTYLSGSFDTGFVTIQDGVNVFHSIKQLYYSNYLTSSLGDPLSTRSLVPGPRGPQGENLGFDTYVGNVTGPNFDNFLQSSLPQDRKFAQFSASVAPIGFAGTDTKVSESVTVAWDSTPDSLNITFPAGNNPDLVAAGINDTYVLNTVTWNGTLSQSPFISSFAPLTVGAEVAADNTSLVITGGPGTTTLTNQPLTSFTYNGIGVGASIDVVAVASVVTKITITVAGDNYEAGDVITITAAQMNSFGGLSTFGGSTTFTILQSDLTPETSTINANLLVPNGVNPNVATNKRGLTLRNNNSVNFITAGGAGTFTLNYLLAPRGPSVISIPSKLFGERVQPSSFQFEYTSSLNFTRSIVEDDGQGNLIVTQSNAAGTPFFSGSVGQIFYSQGIAVITGPDSGSLREFAHNVGYKNNMNPNIVSSSIAYSSSISIDENQYKCVVRNNEFLNTTNPSALGPAGELSKSNNQLFSSFDAGTLNLAASANNVYAMQPRNIVGDVKATTFYIFGDRATTTTIGQQYIVELESSGGKNLQYVGYDGNENGTLNSLGQVQFNSTGSAVGIAKGFCDAINSSEGFNGQISASLQSTVSGLDTVKLTQDQAGTIGNTFIKYTDSFNLLLAEGAYAPIPPRGQVRFGNTLQPAGNPQPVDGTDTFNATKGAILNVTVNSNAITNITVSSSISSMGISQSFSGRGYNAGDRLEILASQVGAGSGAGLGTGSISLTQTDVINEGGSEIYHDFVTGSYFSPFVTTVGLYNKNSDLIAVGKFPRPIPISLQTDTTYVINFDTN